MRLRPSHHRVLALAPAVAMAWVLVVGLPVAPRAATPGHLDSATVVLTGPKAVAVAPAGAPANAARRTTGKAAKGWSAGVEVAKGTQMVALTWDAASAATQGTVSVRSHTDGRWTVWQAKSADPDEGPDTGGNGRTGIGPVWLGRTGADRVEVRVDGAALANLSLLKMRWVEPTAGSGGQAHAETIGGTIRPRTDWAPAGWDKDNAGCGSGPTTMNQLKFAVVHHTVNANDYTAAQVPGILAGIYRYHTGSMGWCDIAYNFVIDRFGTVWQGRSGDINVPVLGGHAKGFNSDSVGVALLGQYEPGAAPPAAKPSTAQLTALQKVLAWKLGIHAVDPEATVSVVSKGSTSIAAGRRVTIPTIIGHRQVGSTDCPGQNVYDKLPAVRDAVASLIAGAVNPAAWKPFSSPQAIAAQQYQDFLGRTATNTDQAGWASHLQRDGATPASQIAALMGSSEFTTKTAPVVRLYLAYFGRVPDHSGLTYWLDQFHRGKATLDKVSGSFAASSEFVRTYGPLTDRAFVDRIYQNVLGRAADANGLDYWAGQLEAGTRGRGAVMTGFSESTEYRRITASRVAVDMVYEAMLGRAPAPQAFVQWVGKLEAGSKVDELIAQAYSGGEYANRIRAIA